MTKEIIEQVKIDEIICLHISSWNGISVGAEHFYGNLSTYMCCDIPDHELKRKIKEVTEARYLSKKVGYKGMYKVGDETSCFTTSNQVIKEARKKYKKLYPGTKVIVLGNTGICSPQEIILGPRVFKREVNKIWRAYEKIWKIGRKRKLSDDQILDILEPIDELWENIWPKYEE
jgi:hypothetical protein